MYLLLWWKCTTHYELYAIVAVAVAVAVAVLLLLLLLLKNAVVFNATQKIDFIVFLGGRFFHHQEALLLCVDNVRGIWSQH